MRTSISLIKASKFLLLYGVLFLLFACNSDDNANSEAEDQSLSEAATILILVNEARKDIGLNELVLHDALNKAAYEHSLDMETNDYFSHTGLNGSNFSERAINAGYLGAPTGENIARGQTSTTAVFNSWMNSDGHKTNILNANATEMGLGLSGVHWTQIFGKEKTN